MAPPVSKDSERCTCWNRCDCPKTNDVSFHGWFDSQPIPYQEQFERNNIYKLFRDNHPLYLSEERMSRIINNEPLARRGIEIQQFRGHNIVDSISKELKHLAIQYHHRKGTKRIENRIQKLYRTI